MNARVAPRWGYALLTLYVACIGAALALGCVAPLFVGGAPHEGQGIDYFCVPKAFLNLWNGTSAFDTWSAPAYGPQATWFVLHPAVALAVGAYLAWLPPMVSYAVFAGLSLALLVWCGRAFAHRVSAPWERVAMTGAFLASPLVLLLLYTGNLHGLVVLAASLVFLGLASLEPGGAAGVSPARAQAMVGGGLLVSLLTKPVLLFAVPAFLVVKCTRRTAAFALAVYVAVSLVFLLVPALNPETVGLRRIVELATNPTWVREHLNVYRNHFVLTPEMRDNAMHWLHMVAQSGFAWDQPQVMSLPALLVGAGVGAVPGAIFVVAQLVVAPLIVRAKSERDALRALAWLVACALAAHFLAYGVAWEYQFTQLFPVAAFLLLPVHRGDRLRTVMLVAVATYYVPSPQLFYGTSAIDASARTVVRAMRVLPALVLAGGAFVAAVRCCLNERVAD